MKVVSSRTLELRSALPQIWKERKTLSIMQQCLQANCPPPPSPHSFTHQTLLGRVLGMLSILTAAMYGRQFHQSFTQVGYIMHSLTWYSRSSRKLVGVIIHLLAFPATQRQQNNHILRIVHEMLLRVWFFSRISWNLFTGAFFSFLFQFCDVSKLVIIHMKI